MIEYLKIEQCIELRKRLGISLENIGNRVGCTKTVMSYLEKNYKTMNKKILKTKEILYTQALLDYKSEADSVFSSMFKDVVYDKLSNTGECKEKD